MIVIIIMIVVIVIIPSLTDTGTIGLITCIRNGEICLITRLTTTRSILGQPDQEPLRISRLSPDKMDGQLNRQKTRPDTRPISSRWRVGRGSTPRGRGSRSVGRGCILGGQGLLCSEITNTVNFASYEISRDRQTDRPRITPSYSQRLKISLVSSAVSVNTASCSSSFPRKETERPKP